MDACAQNPEDGRHHLIVQASTLGDDIELRGFCRLCGRYLTITAPVAALSINWHARPAVPAFG